MRVKRFVNNERGDAKSVKYYVVNFILEIVIVFFRGRGEFYGVTVGKNSDATLKYVGGDMAAPTSPLSLNARHKFARAVAILFAGVSFPCPFVIAVLTCWTPGFRRGGRLAFSLVTEMARRLNDGEKPHHSIAFAFFFRLSPLALCWRFGRFLRLIGGCGIFRAHIAAYRSLINPQDVGDRAV